MTGKMTGLALAALMMTLVEAQAQVSAPKLLVRGAAARIEIIPEDRVDIVATVGAATGAGARLPVPEVRREGANLVVDGKLQRRIRNCGVGGPGRTPSLTINGVGRVAASDLPTITIRAPRDLVAEIANAGRTGVGAARTGTMHFEGCGDAVIAPVSGDLTVGLDGSGDVDFAAVGGNLAAELDGSGDIRGGAVRGDAMLGLDGSGDIGIASVAGALTAELDGSGDVVVQSSKGPMTLSLDGSGDILVRDGTAARFVARLDGSGDIAFLGVAGDVDASLDGSGDIHVSRATGAVRKSKDGSGDITIGS